MTTKANQTESGLKRFWRRINKSDGPAKGGFGKPKQKRDIKGFLSKLAQGFMLPVSILPIAGLLLGIGGAIGANVDKSNTGAIEFANFLKGISDFVFANLPIIFCMAVAMAFTNKNAVYAAFMAVIAYIVFNGVQYAFVHYENVTQVVSQTVGGTSTEYLQTTSQFKDILYFHTSSNNQFMVTNNLGIRSLQTSIFGGIIIGSIVAFMMNRWSEIQLPSALNFFSGIRLIPMMLLPVAAALALIFLVIWPFIGQLIALIGNATAAAPAGVDGLVYGIVGRALQPLGLHHIIIGVAFQSPFGGSLNSAQLTTIATNMGIQNTIEYQTMLATINEKWNGNITGDQNLWNFANSLPFNYIPTNTSGGSASVFQWMERYLGVYAGRFTQDYPTYIGACMGIGAALILMAERANRKKVAGVVGSAMAVAFITGITEPLEYTFLFVAPLYYYIIYVPLSGLSYMMMKLFGAHVGVGFARGFIDLIVYGAVPISKGTNFWIAFPVAAVSGLISFGTFAIGIKRFNWETPGRGSNQITLTTKAMYKAAKGSSASEVDEETADYIQAYGGIENIVSVTACATRLRITVKDGSLVNKQKLKKMGSMGFVEKGASSQNILGGKAIIVAGRISKAKGN